jgi:hypothetical protein
LTVEELEGRILLSVFTPAQIRHAYGFDQVTFNGGTVKGDGSGQTIAIVDAFDNPNIVNDLHTFDARFGLADPVLTKVTSPGQSTPAYNASWATEIALDVEWAHAIAPGANILLVETQSNALSDLLGGVNYARNYDGVVAVSMSWGGAEFSGEKAFDSIFTTPTGHRGVTFVASSGDSGPGAQYPAASPNVVSVGGTSLTVSDAQGTYGSETAWSGSGGGTSQLESQPSYQNGLPTSQRTTTDVAYAGDPNTGVYVYNSSGGGWLQAGGTSAGAPQWAGLIAIADQGRSLAGEGSLDGATNTLPALYQLRTDFHPVTPSNSGGPSATAGTALMTGLGTPRANLLIPALVSVPTATKVTAPKTASNSGTTSTPSTTSTQPVKVGNQPRAQISTTSTDVALFNAAVNTGQTGSSVLTSSGGSLPASASQGVSVTSSGAASTYSLITSARSYGHADRGGDGTEAKEDRTAQPTQIRPVEYIREPSTNPDCEPAPILPPSVNPPRQPEANPEEVKSPATTPDLGLALRVSPVTETESPVAGLAVGLGAFWMAYGDGPTHRRRNRF